MLTLWKRHSKTCKKTNAKEFAKLPLDQHRLFKKCQCACWVTGKHPKTEQEIKQSLNVTSWDVAEKLKAELEGSTPASIEAKKITIEQAYEKWIATKSDNGVGEISLETGYAAFLVVLLEFAKDYGISLISQFDDQAAFALVESPRWRKWKISTRARQLSTLRSFFTYCVGRRWLTLNPADGIPRPDNSGLGSITAYQPDEWDRLEVAFGNWTEKVKTCSSQWALRPTTLHCFKHVLEDTGLRCSDALRVRPAIIERLPSGDGECTLRQTKGDRLKVAATDCEVTVYLQKSTLDEMERVPWCSEKYPFMTEPANEADPVKFKRHLAAQRLTVYGAMQQVGKVAGVDDCRPHRFRHTFANMMLEKGWDLEKVSRFLGHKNISITDRFYAKWSKNRQRQLREEVINKWEKERAVPQIRKPRKAS